MKHDPLEPFVCALFFLWAVIVAVAIICCMGAVPKTAKGGASLLLFPQVKPAKSTRQVTPQVQGPAAPVVKVWQWADCGPQPEGTYYHIYQSTGSLTNWVLILETDDHAFTNVCDQIGGVYFKIGSVHDGIENFIQCQ